MYLLWSAEQHRHLFNDDAGPMRQVFRENVSQFSGLILLLLLGSYYMDLDYEVKFMEPWYQLSTTTGSLGHDSMCVDYFTTLTYFSPFKAWGHGHWAVVCSSIASIISNNVLPSLAVGIFGIYTPDVGKGMDRTYTIAFEVFAAILAFNSVGLYVLLRRRKTGIDYNPFHTFETMKATQRRDGSNTFNQFIEKLRNEWKHNSMSNREASDSEKQSVKGGLSFDEISSADLDEYFGPRRFRLERRHGDESIMLYVLDDEPAISQTRWSKFTEKIGIPCWNRFRTKHLWSEAHPMLFQTIPLSIYTTILLALFVIATGQPFWAENHAFFEYIGSRRFARSALAQVVNTVIWEQIQKHALLMHPFYEMRKQGGTSLDIVISLEPFKDIYDAIREIFVRRFHSGYGRETVSLKPSDFVMLSILIAGIAGQFFAIFWTIIAFGYSPLIFAGLITTEALMVIAMILIWLYRRKPILPRLPVTLASLMMYTYSSNFNVWNLELLSRKPAGHVLPRSLWSKFINAPIRYVKEPPTISIETPNGTFVSAELNTNFSVSEDIKALAPESSGVATIQSHEISKAPGAVTSEVTILTDTPSPYRDISIDPVEPTLVSIPISQILNTTSSPSGDQSTDDTVEPMDDTPPRTTKSEVGFIENTIQNVVVKIDWGTKERARIKFGFGRFTVDGEEHVGIALYDTVTRYKCK
jgi:hypothetical protein